MKEKTISSCHISIALCTYNGEQFLKEQLDSIKSQTCLPDEIVICDDVSTDKTVAIIKDFASRSLCPVYLYINDKNLGSTKNFEKAINLCKGDIIFLADQDDIWHEDKIEKIREIFVKSPEIDAVFTDAIVVDQNLRLISSSLWREFNFDQKKRNTIINQDAFQLLLEGNVVTGATMAFRGKYKHHVLPFPDNFTGQFRLHDGWIMLIISAAGKISMISEPLISYRQHEKNQIGLKYNNHQENLINKWKNAHRYRRTKIKEACENYKKLQEHLNKMPFISSDKNQLVLDKIKHLTARSSLPVNIAHRLKVILHEIKHQRYYRFSNGWYSIIRDIFLI